MEEETSKRPKFDGDGSSPDIVDDEEPTENLLDIEKDINGDKQQTDQVDTVENLNGSDGKENDSTLLVQVLKTVKLILLHKLTGLNLLEFKSTMKVVMHEESNQYYYWNAVTGETSWEVPTALAGQTVSGNAGDISRSDAHLSIESATYAYASAVDERGSSHLISKDAGDVGRGF